MKNYLDERQNEVVGKIAVMALFVMFGICTLTIISQLIFLESSISDVAGETLSLLGGGMVYLAASVKNGLFLRKGHKVSVRENLMISTICSGVFSALFGFVLRSKVTAAVSLGRYIGIFFAAMIILGFLAILALGKSSDYLQRQSEKKYNDE